MITKNSIVDYSIISVKMILFLFLLLLPIKVVSEGNIENDSIKFHDGQEFAIIGKYHTEKNYDRLPQKYENIVSARDWGLSQQSAGISIRFRSNASKIVVKWTLKGDNLMDHMAFTGIKGVDLYAWVDHQWKYTATGRVKGKINEYTLVENGGNIFREYLLNLPLYDGINSLSIGINSKAEISLPKEHYLIGQKPVVYYGSSIAQGGCASRPGMAFTNIMSRRLNRSFINLGFSGSGKFDLSVGQAMCDIDAALYVIDCNPNTKTDQVYDGAVKLVKLLKQKRPNVPILIVEGYLYTSGFTKPADSENHKKNVELLRAYKTLKQLGLQKLYYCKGVGLIGFDYEGTVDGVHPNDLGMMRIADFLRPKIQMIIK
jgi:hypothetical protein